jgi:hypothetical protein
MPRATARELSGCINSRLRHEGTPEPSIHWGQRAAVGVLAAAVALGFTAGIALAVHPAKNTKLGGSTSYRVFGKSTLVSMKVSRTGTRLTNVLFSEDCSGGHGPRLTSVKVTSRGTFSAKRSYRQVIKRARKGRGGFLDDVKDWKVTFAGKFISATSAKGTFSWRLHDELRDSNTGKVDPNTVNTCRTGKSTWKAKKL